MAVQLAMMAATERHGELVADLASQRASLRMAQMVSVRRLAAADQASLLGDIVDMIVVHHAGGDLFAALRNLSIN